MSDSAPLVETPAPAPPVPTISAERDAANRGDFSAFEDASEAIRKGTPKPRVEVKAEPSAPVAPFDDAAEPAPTAPVTPPISNRQQAINENIRKAVEAARAEDRAEIDRLRRQLAPQPTRQPAPAAEPEWKRIAAMPDAPKIADFESVEEHAAAMADFVYGVKEQARAHQQLSQQRETYESTRISQFDARVTELEKTDPDIASVIVPIAQEMSRKGGPYAVMSDAILDSDLGPQLLRHLGEHPEIQQSIATLPPHLRGLPPAVAVREHAKLITKALAKLEASLERPAVTPEPEPAPSPISAAPPPAPRLARTGATTDPQAAALARRDFAAWEKHETAKDLARRGAA